MNTHAPFNFPSDYGELHRIDDKFSLQDVLNTFCWIHSTYTIPSAFWKRIGVDVAHPGIDKTVDPDERRYVRYYQWVCFCLFFQVQTSLHLAMSLSCLIAEPLFCLTT